MEVVAADFTVNMTFECLGQAFLLFTMSLRQKSGTTCHYLPLRHLAWMEVGDAPKSWTMVSWVRYHPTLMRTPYSHKKFDKEVAIRFKYSNAQKQRGMCYSPRCSRATHRELALYCLIFSVQS